MSQSPSVEDRTLRQGRFGAFAVEVTFDDERAVVGVRGDIDILTAPTLTDLLGVLADRGHPDIVLDLAGVSFMDGSGLTIIADTAARLREVGGVLTLRSAPTHTKRILDITGVSDLVTTEAFGTGAGIASDLTTSVTMLARNAIVDAALGLLVDLATSSVEGADGASVSLERHGRIVTVAASNDTVLEMDGHQYDTGQGPCLSAAAEGHHVYTESLAEEKRWPEFIPRAISEGIASILSTPLLATHRSVGALNIYSNRERAFGERQQEMATLFAAQATGIVADLEDGDDPTRERVSMALMSRDITSRACGVLMARHHVTEEAAATMLYRAARSASTPVLQHATEIVASTSSDAVGDLDGARG